MDPDKLISEEKPQSKEIHVDHMIDNASNKIKKFFRFLKKWYGLFLFLFLIILIFLAGYFVKKCPICETCQVCEECITCPDLDCSECPKEIDKITAIRYACSNGLIVDDLDKCNPLNHIKIESKYKETDNGVIFSIDKIEYETVGSYSKITEIGYTIVNIGDHEIKPIILVNIYSPLQERSEQGLVHEIFDDDEYINSDSWVIKKQSTNIGFKDDGTVLRLVLKDKLPDPDKELVRVSRPLDE
jgi:hypothetical protein